MQSNWLFSLHCALLKSVELWTSLRKLLRKQARAMFLGGIQKTKGPLAPQVECTGHFLDLSPSGGLLEHLRLLSEMFCWKPKDSCAGNSITEHHRIPTQEAELFRAALQKPEIYLVRVSLVHKPHQVPGPLFWEAKTTLTLSTHTGEKLCRVLLFPKIHSFDLVRHCNPGAKPQFCNNQHPGHLDKRDC